jgi:hypothetical protein
MAWRRNQRQAAWRIGNGGSNIGVAWRGGMANGGENLAAWRNISACPQLGI